MSLNSREAVTEIIQRAQSPHETDRNHLTIQAIAQWTRQVSKEGGVLNFSSGIAGTKEKTQ